MLLKTKVRRSAVGDLGIGEEPVGGVDASQEQRDLHQRRGGVVDGEVGEAGAVRRPPVRRVAQQDLLCGAEPGVSGKLP